MKIIQISSVYAVEARTVIIYGLDEEGNVYRRQNKTWIAV
jgi:hypothetical protein